MYKQFIATLSHSATLNKENQEYNTTQKSLRQALTDILEFQLYLSNLKMNYLLFMYK